MWVGQIIAMKWRTVQVCQKVEFTSRQTEEVKQDRIFWWVGERKLSSKFYDTTDHLKKDKTTN